MIQNIIEIMRLLAFCLILWFALAGAIYFAIIHAFKYIAEHSAFVVHNPTKKEGKDGN